MKKKKIGFIKLQSITTGLSHLKQKNHTMKFEKH